MFRRMFAAEKYYLILRGFLIFPTAEAAIFCASKLSARACTQSSIVMSSIPFTRACRSRTASLYSIYFPYAII